MTLHPHISLGFNGQCEAAFRVYERCLGGSASLLTWRDSMAAAEAPPGWEEKIVHATLKIGETVLMGSDVPPERYEQPKGFSVLLGVDDPTDAERVFHALAENGTVEMPIQETFWTMRFGSVIDQFGIPWSINCDRPPEPTA